MASSKVSGLITVAFEDMLDLKSKGLRFSGPIAFRQEC